MQIAYKIYTGRKSRYIYSCMMVARERKPELRGVIGSCKRERRVHLPSAARRLDTSSRARLACHYTSLSSRERCASEALDAYIAHENAAAAISLFDFARAPSTRITIIHSHLIIMSALSLPTIR